MKRIILLVLLFMPFALLAQTTFTKQTVQGDSVILSRGATELTPSFPDANRIAFDEVLNTQLQAALTDNTPTDSEIDAATGLTPASAGAGYHRTIKDTSGSGLLYRIESDGSDWYYIVMTKAVN